MRQAKVSISLAPISEGLDSIGHPARGGDFVNTRLDDFAITAMALIIFVFSFSVYIPRRFKPLREEGVFVGN